MPMAERKVRIACPYLNRLVRWFLMCGLDPWGFRHRRIGGRRHIWRRLPVRGVNLDAAGKGYYTDSGIQQDIGAFARCGAADRTGKRGMDMQRKGTDQD